MFMDLPRLLSPFFVMLGPEGHLIATELENNLRAKKYMIWCGSQLLWTIFKPSWSCNDFVLYGKDGCAMNMPDSEANSNIFEDGILIVAMCFIVDSPNQII